MSGSMDYLRKKVCVTVFLDELFEEILEDDWKNVKQVEQTPETQVTTSKTQYEKTSLIEEKAVDKKPSKDDIKQGEVQVRPRKHRTQSKFSLRKYDYESRNKKENERQEVMESSVSESDVECDEKFELKKWTRRKSTGSFTELSEINISPSNFSSKSSNILSKGTGFCSSKKKVDQSASKLRPKLKTLVSNKSTQFNSAGANSEKLRNADEEEVMTCKKTQAEIYLVLNDPKSKESEERCLFSLEGMQSIGNCDFEKGAGKLKPLTVECCSRELYKPCTRVLIKKKPRDSKKKVKKLWTNAKKYEAIIGSHNISNNYRGEASQKNSLLCYALCLKTDNNLDNDDEEDDEEDDEDDEDDDDEDDEYDDDDSDDSEDTEDTEDSEETDDSDDDTYDDDDVDEDDDDDDDDDDDLKKDEIDDLNALDLISDYFKEKSSFDGLKSKMTHKCDSGFKLLNNEISLSEIRFKAESRNFAEGDTFEQFFRKSILDIRQKNLIVCDDVLQHIPQQEIIVNRTEIKLLGDAYKKGTEKQLSLKSSHPFPTSISQLFFKKPNMFGGNITEVESEMIFADTETEDDVIMTLSSSPPDELCVVKIRDIISLPKILKNKETEEFFGDDLMEKISAKFILVCSSDSESRNSLFNISECYLKDSEDSTMYLIEVPIQFVKSQSEKGEWREYYKKFDSE